MTKLSDTKNVALSVEYNNLHAQRIALVNIIHSWYKLGFGGSAAMFGFFLTSSLLGQKPVLLIIGAIFSVLVVVFGLWMALRVDRGVVRLYPRIIYIEVLLDYQFYRNYLKNAGKQNPEHSFVVQAENIVADNEEQAWVKTLEIFPENGFSSGRRNHWPLYLATIILSLCYLVAATVLTLTISFV